MRVAEVHCSHLGHPQSPQSLWVNLRPPFPHPQYPAGYLEALAGKQRQSKGMEEEEQQEDMEVSSSVTTKKGKRKSKSSGGEPGSFMEGVR